MQPNSAVILLILLFLIPAHELNAQENPSQRGAFFRSLAVPGWGHYYADRDDWRRGQVHLAAEAVLIASFFGLNARAGNLENNFITLSRLKGGVDIAGRDRAFRLAVGDYNSLGEYNDFQLRSRNWDRLFDDTPENRWQWETETDRRRYRDMRSDADRLKNQLPGIIGLMVVNRVVSGISALNRARNNTNIPEVTLAPVHEKSGIMAHLQWRF